MLRRAALSTYASSQALHAPRRRVLFFRGSFREREEELECYLPNRSVVLGDAEVARRCRHVYSMGIRQAVRRELGGHPMLDLGSPGQRLSETKYMDALKSSQWCVTTSETHLAP